MTRYAPSTLNYSFGPGPITPAVKWLIWANVGGFVAGILFPIITDYLGLITGIPQQSGPRNVQDIEPAPEPKAQ